MAIEAAPRAEFSRVQCAPPSVVLNSRPLTSPAVTAVAAYTVPGFLESTASVVTEPPKGARAVQVLVAAWPATAAAMDNAIDKMNSFIIPASFHLACTRSRCQVLSL